MIHPLFTQYDEDLGNRLNAGRPADDRATYGETITVFGVAGWNGLSLTDNPPNVMFSIAANAQSASGSARSRSPRSRLKHFHTSRELRAGRANLQRQLPGLDLPSCLEQAIMWLLIRLSLEN